MRGGRKIFFVGDVEGGAKIGKEKWKWIFVRGCIGRKRELDRQIWEKRKDNSRIPEDEMWRQYQRWGEQGA